MPPPPGEGAKIWDFGRLGKKYEILIVPGGKDIILEKGGGRANISIILIISTAVETRIIENKVTVSEIVRAQ